MCFHALDEEILAKRRSVNSQARRGSKAFVEFVFAATGSIPLDALRLEIPDPKPPGGLEEVPPNKQLDYSLTDFIHIVLHTLK